VVVPVFGRSRELRRCLDALLSQREPPSAEVLVVDDGSRPAVCLHGVPVPSPGTELRVIRQEHAGVAAARNRGIALARGRLVVFVDSDVVPDPGFLLALASAARAHPLAPAFQARLVGNPERFTWRIEGARLEATQGRLLRPDGTMAYLNTSAVAVRRPLPDLPPVPGRPIAGRGPDGDAAAVPGRPSDLFEVGVRRGEDTLLLLRLRRAGTLPVWVPQAVAQHRPTGTLGAYLGRHLRIGYLDAESRRRAGAVGGLVTGSERLRFLGPLLAGSGGGPRGRIVFLLALVAFALEVVGRLAGTAVHGLRPHGPRPLRAGRGEPGSSTVQDSRRW